MVLAPIRVLLLGIRTVRLLRYVVLSSCFVVSSLVLQVRVTFQVRVNLRLYKMQLGYIYGNCGKM